MSSGAIGRRNNEGRQNKVLLFSVCGGRRFIDVINRRDKMQHQNRVSPRVPADTHL